MQETVYTELFKIPSEKFAKHLDSEINERILFSGKFGKGKTTFLRYFFGERQKIETETQYFTIHISPVNYSVASNEDIFKYIKFDIILEILKMGVEFEESDFDFMDTLPLFIRKHPEKIIGKLLSAIPLVGKEFDNLFVKGKKLYEEVKEHNEKLNAKGEGNQLEEFIEKVEMDEGSIYENDFVTKIIEKAMAKVEAEGKKTVLVIDDLDRLDPEHIFRILNVFASQFNIYNNIGKSNKFDLGKIIIVCDLDNIRNIYKNRYGANVDFVGYVDKFYSTEPFYFNNYEELKDIVYKILQSVQLKGWGGTMSLSNYISHKIAYSIGVNEIVRNLIFFDFLSLRSLLIYSKNRVFELSKNYQIGEAYFENENFPIIIEVQIINSLLGGYESSIFTFEKLTRIASRIVRGEHYFNRILLLLTHPKNGHVNDPDSFLHIDFDEKELRFKVIDGEAKQIQKYHKSTWIDFTPSTPDFFKALIVLFTLMYTNGIIE